MSRKSSNGCLVKAILGFVFLPIIIPATAILAIVTALCAFIKEVTKPSYLYSRGRYARRRKWL